MMKKFTYGSVCSGIEAASVAWHEIGEPQWFSEIEPFPCAVLAYRFPQVPNVGNMLGIAEKIRKRELNAPDVLVGGTPCQAFSIAGKRNSLDDERGNLTLALIDILDAIDEIREQDGKEPCVLVWENVPGVFSTKDNAFGCFLAGLVGESLPLGNARGKWSDAGCVFSPRRQVAWRKLDAQFFNLPQRRQRVFLVASARRRPFAVEEILFERKSCTRDIEPSEEVQQAVTTFVETSFGGYRSGEGKVGTLRRETHGHEPLIFEIKGKEVIRTADGNKTPTLKARAGTGGNNLPYINHNSIVRKITPMECERLMGFPDGHTLIPWRNGMAADTPRYKALGNSMAVPVMKWIGQRLEEQLND